MVGDDYADVLVLERRDDRLDVLHGDRVHAREGFVEQDEGRVDGHGARDLRAAALAARELDAEALADLLQAELLDERLDALGLVLLRVGGHLQHGADVLLDREPPEDRGLLRQVAHAQLGAAVDGQARELGDLLVVVLEEDATLVGLDESHDHVERRGLAGSVGSEQADDLSLIDVDGDVVHHRAGLVFLDEFAGIETHCGCDKNFHKVMFFFRKNFYLYVEFLIFRAETAK